ncbi:ribonuclease H protein, partial [Trifolium medium]|nr:ribonuclease H protein [Trifolium medium]
YNAQMDWKAYNSLKAQNNNSLANDSICDKMWKTMVPPKQTHLIWRILHKALPIKPNLISKESIQIISSITYSIWFARNKQVFQNKNTPVNEAVDHALRTLHDYHHHTTVARLDSSNSRPSVGRNNKSWSPPPKTFLKLNVDAHLSDDGHWGLGMVLRRDDGRCVGAATKVYHGSNDAAMAEATGLREALLWVKSQKMEKVIIEMDAESIVKAVNSRIFPRNQWGQLVRSCARNFDHHAHLSVKWVNRRGNQPTHVLARWALSEPNQLWSNNFPSCIISHIALFKLNEGT